LWEHIVWTACRCSRFNRLNGVALDRNFGGPMMARMFSQAAAAEVGNNS
jgi:hypothetical protein